VLPQPSDQSCLCHPLIRLILLMLCPQVSDCKQKLAPILSLHQSGLHDLG
jgi:hypothetical protein